MKVFVGRAVKSSCNDIQAAMQLWYRGDGGETKACCVPPKSGAGLHFPLRTGLELSEGLDPCFGEVLLWLTLCTCLGWLDVPALSGKLFKLVHWCFNATLTLVLYFWISLCSHNFLIWCCMSSVASKQTCCRKEVFHVLLLLSYCGRPFLSHLCEFCPKLQLLERPLSAR